MVFLRIFSFWNLGFSLWNGNLHLDREDKHQFLCSNHYVYGCQHLRTRDSASGGKPTALWIFHPKVSIDFMSLSQHRLWTHSAEGRREYPLWPLITWTLVSITTSSHMLLCDRKTGSQKQDVQPIPSQSFGLGSQIHSKSCPWDIVLMW